MRALLGAALALCTMAAGVEAREVLVDSLASAENWQVGGERINYTLGRSALVATDEVTRDGQPCLKLTYDFRDARRGYISAYHTGPAILGECDEVAVWVYGNNSGRMLRFAIEDARARWFERDVRPIDWEGWREVRVPIADGAGWRAIVRRGEEALPVRHPVNLRQIAVARSDEAEPEGAIYLSGLTATCDVLPADYIRTTIGTGRPANLFDIGEDPQVTVELANDGERSVSGSLTAQATDFFGEGFAMGEQDVEIGAGETVQKAFSCRTDGLGQYDVSVLGRFGAREREWYARFAVTRPREGLPADAGALFGSMFNVDGITPAQMEIVWRLNRDAGIRWTRIGFNWGEINPAARVWIWDGPRRIDGPVGIAVDPEGRALRVPHSPALDCPDAVTIAFWACGAEENGGWQAVLQKWGQGNERNYGVYFHRDTGNVCFSASYEDLPAAEWKDVDSGVSAWNDEWHHYAASYSREAKQVRLHVDGELVAREEFDGGRLRTNAADLVIGSGCPAAIDEMVLYSRALDDAEVAALARKDAAPPAGLIAHWAFEGEDSTVTDASGNGFDVLGGEAQAALLAREAEEHGIKTLGLLGFPPAWASTAPEGAERPHVYKPDLAAWADFVENVTRHYADTVQHWELWNEPNITVFWEPDPDPKEFMDVVRVGYEAAKRGNPDCTVIMPGLAGPGEGGWGMAFIDELIELGAARYCDGIAIHPYRQATPEGSDLVGDLRHIGDLCAANGNAEAGGHIWFTENCWTTQLLGGSTEKRAAMMLPRCYALSMGTGLMDRMLWFRLHDPGVDRFYGEHNYGMCYNDLTPKPTYFAHRTVAELLDGATPEGEWDVGPSSIARVFHTPTERIGVLWSPEGTTAASVYVDRPNARVVDIMGNETRMATREGVLTLPLSEAAQFLRDLPAEADGRGTFVSIDPTELVRGETGELTVRLRNPFPSGLGTQVALSAGDGLLFGDGGAESVHSVRLRGNEARELRVALSVAEDATPGHATVSATAGPETPWPAYEGHVAIRGAAPDAGPVGHWMLDEGAGNTIRDSSGNGNDGTVEEPKWVEGVRGMALGFDGTNAAEIPNAESLNLRDEVSVAFWLRLTRPTGNWQFPVGKYSDDPLVRNYGIYIHKDTLAPCFSASFEGGGYLHTDVPTDVGIDDGEWHHLAATYSVFERRLRVYVDGRPVADRPLDEGLMLLTEAPLRLGDGTAAVLDEVMVYPRAISAEEVADLAEG